MPRSSAMVPSGYGDHEAKRPRKMGLAPLGRYMGVMAQAVSRPRWARPEVYAVPPAASGADGLKDRGHRAVGS